MQSAPDARLGAFASSSRAVSRASRPSPVVAHVSTQAEKQPAQLLGNPTAAWLRISEDTAACSSLLCMASDGADNEVSFDSQIVSTKLLTVLALADAAAAAAVACIPVSAVAKDAFMAEFEMLLSDPGVL